MSKKRKVQISLKLKLECGEKLLKREKRKYSMEVIFRYKIRFESLTHILFPKQILTAL